MKQKTEDLKREIGVFGLSANIVNIIVGAGIFALPAFVAAGLGSASIFAYLFCGILITLVMLCFAEAGSRLTSGGGAYQYINTAFGPYFGFLTSILFILAAISADAAIANAVLDIFGSILPFFKLLPVKILSFFFFFSGFAYFNIKGVKNGIKVIKTVIIIKLIPLLLIVFFSWGEVSVVNLSVTSIPTFKEIVEISLILFFAFQGAEAALSISGEVKNPKINIPRGIFVSIVSVLILYILIQTVSQGVLGASLSTFKENPLGAVAIQVFGPIGFTIMTIGAAISMLGALSSAIMSMPRILFQSAKDNVLPIPSLTKVHAKYHTPYISVITYASAGFLFASIGGFEQLAIISSATVLLIYLGVSLSVIKLRRSTTGEENAFKIPGGILVPLLSSATIIYMLSNLARTEFIVIIGAIAVLTIFFFMKNKVAIK